MFRDDFSGPNGALVGTTPDRGSVWTQLGAINTNPIQVSSGAAAIGTSGQDAYSTFAGPVLWSLDEWALTSLDLNLSSAQATGDYFLHLSQPSGSTNFYQRLFARASGAGYQLGLVDTAGSGATTTWGSQVLDFGTNYHVDIQWNMVAGSTNDTFDVRVNHLPYLSHAWTSTTAEPTEVAAINLRQGTAGDAPAGVLDNLISRVNVFNGSRSETIVESRTGGQNFAAYSDSGVFPNAWQDSSAKSTALGLTPGIGSRFNTGPPVGGSIGGVNTWFEVAPTLPTAGGTYDVYATVTTASGSITATSDISLTGGVGLPATTNAFSTSVSGNTWGKIGTVSLNPGVSTPTIRFFETSNNNRFYADGIMFVELGHLVATWDGANNNWTSNHWNTPLFPHNGNGNVTYDAVVNSGGVSVNQNIVINGLTLTGGTISGNNDLNVSNLNWTGGTFSGSGTTTISGGTISGVGTKTLDSRTLKITGDVEWTAGEILQPTSTQNYGTIEVQSGATFTAVGSPPNRNMRVNLHVNEGGTFRTTGSNAIFIADAGRPAGLAVNNGLIEVGPSMFLAMTGGSGDGDFVIKNNGIILFELEEASDYNFTGTIYLDNAVMDVLVFTPSGIDFLTPATIVGSGTVFADNLDGLINSGEFVVGDTPTTNIGTLEIEGNYLQTADGILTVDIEGVAPNQKDLLKINDAAADLSGKLRINAANFTSSGPGTQYQILTADDVDGEFDKIVTLGSSSVYFTAVYTNTSVNAVEWYLGDMNRDGPINDTDFRLFVLALMDPSQYFDECNCDDFGEAGGDFNHNGRLDFNDIPLFEAQLRSLNISPTGLVDAFNAYFQAIPEPSSGMLAAFGMLTVGPIQRRGFRDIRRAIEHQRCCLA